MSPHILLFKQRGVRFIDEDTVYIDHQLPPTAIAAGAVIYPYSRIEGSQTKIDKNVEIGRGGAVTIRNSHIMADARVGTLGQVLVEDSTVGPGSVLGSGCIEQSVLLGRYKTKETCGYGFRLRTGTLYEEDASSKQFTDTKMTILLPWVTLGANLNFCDALIGGGTSLTHSTEIGSGSIHFNYTPRRDKATASLFGNVTDGVFLREEPLFIGGLGGLVGPLQADFAAFTPAFSRVTHRLESGFNHPRQPQQTRPPRPIILHSLKVFKSVYASQTQFIAQLLALYAWYTHVRIAFAKDNQRLLYERAQKIIALNLAERIKRLDEFIAQSHGWPSSNLTEADQLKALTKQWPSAKNKLTPNLAVAPPPQFLEACSHAFAGHHQYINAVKSLDDNAVLLGKAWLKKIVANCLE